ncbi:NAD(P)-dependent dehydrogenase (short-subunit alcohol dehydrogenase family) [Amycolatopsis bartoniae]|uniref:Oxidoreductase n=1 Tax=Amycolatopsis bartoniae TaxID=941986 RepID=A0A8H9IMW9_9PSEU|nr:SDR family NAD(P)-dependent oxidoreductase [Amycolatopsis bartoniae]MBB2939699.1 NAD(P)-dependent dehydrogenase (short-subunit alcohol dehydrogenase family) [Amycolatopsis bartoniae]GHF36413.1 oxidoreductase [Amycolatopsis bartoniae]
MYADSDFKVAVITGAGSGIGRSLAKRFATAGMHVVIADIQEKGLRETQDLIGADRCTIKVTNVADEDAVVSLADFVWSEFGQVDVVCNNAGTLGPMGDPLWEIPLAEWTRVLSVNFLGVVHGIRAFVPRLLAAGRRAHIVNTASMGGFTVSPVVPQYNASKHAVVALTEALRLQLAARQSSISVTMVCPGPVETNIVASQQAQTGADGDQADWGARAIGTPTTHLSPDVVAEKVFHAIQNNSFYVFTNPGSRQRIEERVSHIMESFEPC